MAVAVATVGVVGAVALNVTGVARMPIGPLGTSDEPGEFRQIAVAPKDAPEEVFTTVILRNEWPLPATLEAVSPILGGSTGGAEILGAQPYDSTILTRRQQLVLGSVRERPGEWTGEHPVAGTQVPASAEGSGAVALVRVWGEPGAATDVAGYAVDYRVGPFAFRTISTTNSIVLCSNDGPAPAGCDDAEQATEALEVLLRDTAWRLLVDEPTRDTSVLHRAVKAAGYTGSLARAFVFTVVQDDDRTREILVAPGVTGAWEIATALE